MEVPLSNLYKSIKNKIQCLKPNMDKHISFNLYKTSLKDSLIASVVWLKGLPLNLPSFKGSKHDSGQAWFFCEPFRLCGCHCCQHLQHSIFPADGGPRLCTQHAHEWCPGPVGLPISRALLSGVILGFPMPFPMPGTVFFPFHWSHLVHNVCLVFLIWGNQGSFSGLDPLHSELP